MLKLAELIERDAELIAKLETTVLLNSELNSKLYSDEIFGPVLSVRTFKPEEEAIKLANDTTNGLSYDLIFRYPAHVFLLTSDGRTDKSH
ncbi:uncharacterized protein A1O9_11169 [Exophiala aquamarina CBS 119918]|uniref:Aldehyde dehydrogenase domain-containing protein n=1 Tax=Exophiala aquamarina CBS 119918 TaxID=1182545 RepID=A0A072NZC0_9EURO|nr:uncharacterized protein A1O9_11169 [Exophiala aquamarina CBS 119918]KEF52752.1 hypothetical protein A1O9_11169 [Exophiala aquamarina CBS 119918]